MKRTLLLVALLSFPGPASAQSPEDPALLIYSGVTIPRVAYGDSLRAGVNLGAAVDLPIRNALALQLAAGYYSLAWRFERGRDSGLFGMGNLKLGIPLRGSRAAPYLIGGLGVWRSGFSDLLIESDGVTPRPRREGREESRLAYNVGMGVTLPLTRNAGVFAQARYVIVRTDGPGVRMVPFEFGIRLSRRWARESVSTAR